MKYLCARCSSSRGRGNFLDNFVRKTARLCIPVYGISFSNLTRILFHLFFFLSFFTHKRRQKNFDDTEKRIRVLKLIDLINEQDKK